MPSDSSFAMTYSLDRVGLTVGCRVCECRHRETTCLDAEQELVLCDVDAEAPRRRELRNQTAVGDGREVTDAELAGRLARDALECDETVGDEALRPHDL